MKPWELLILKPFSPYYFQNSAEDTASYSIDVPRDILCELLNMQETMELTDSIPSCVIPVKDKKIIMEYFRQIRLREGKSRPLEQKLMLCCIVQFFDYIKRLIPRASEILLESDSALKPEMILAIQFIHENYRDCELGMDDVLNHIHMSRSRFCEVFHQTTGQTFLKYLNALRIESAKADLRRSNKPLTLLADNNGFASAAHMARNFNAAVGMPPSEYRKRYKEN